MNEFELLHRCETVNVPAELRTAVVTVLQTNTHFPGVDKETMFTIAEWTTAVHEVYAEPVAGYNYETGLVDE